jgi:hypothetical protein
MNRITASLLIVASSIFAVSVNASSLGAPAAVPTTSTTSTVTTSTTTTSLVPIPPAARCPKWWPLAAETGFTSEQLPTLDRILFRESRCHANQHNPTDPNGGSHGLTQINGFWCLPSRYYPNGYLQTVGVLSSCADLYEPTVNLRAAFALVSYSRSVGLSDWSQWAWLDENGSEND